MKRRLAVIGIAAIAFVVGLNALVWFLPETPDQNFHPVCTPSTIATADANIKCANEAELVQRRDNCAHGTQPCFGVDTDGWDTDVLGYGKCRSTKNQSCTPAPFRFATIEYKSDGPGIALRWQHEQVQAIKNEIRSLNRVYLVVFVHGWNHDARETPGVELPDLESICVKGSQDANLRFFKDILAKSKWELLRRGDYDRTVLGVYIGWNGGADDYFFPFSIGSRARAADRVGRSEQLADDLMALTSELQNADKSNRALIMGHSLGGRILSRFMLRASQFGNLKPLGPGVLVSTVNPAIGADEFEEYVTLPKQSELPYWINVTSKDDWATGRIFPLAASFGRILGFGRGVSDHIADIRGYLTIGHYRAFQTHRLELTHFQAPDCDPRSGTNAGAHVVGHPDPFMGRTTNWYRLDGDEKSNYRAVYFGCEPDRAIPGCGTDCSAAHYYSRLSIAEAPHKRFHQVSGSMWNLVTDENLIEGDEKHRGRYSSHTAFVQTALNRMLIELLFEN
ncbi:hypothetical protein [Bradyrhizobium uaiense]|uniref:Alpha/beta hydrolase n=1 Tax=Bradyrhizobium uaiense TaxID=2594946 RepID=A0A6P1BU42_9BRAD|nr:hypothetical protein [Bradyrhizobium uaiense]NEV01062.1 hypothetical protein [Bradyrhizobium uaiense]